MINVNMKFKKKKENRLVCSHTFSVNFLKSHDDFYVSSKRLFWKHPNIVQLLLSVPKTNDLFLFFANNFLLINADRKEHMYIFTIIMCNNIVHVHNNT